MATQEISGRSFEAKLRNIDSTLRTARADFQKAALQHDEGTIGTAELEQADCAIRTLETRRRALIAADAERSRQAEARDQEADKQWKFESARELRGLADIIEEQFTAAVACIDAAETHLAAQMAARKQAMLIAVRHSRSFRDRQQLGDMRRAVLVDRNRERWAIDGALYRAGFGDFGLGSQQAMDEAKGKDPAFALTFVLPEIRGLAAMLERSDEEGE